MKKLVPLFLILLSFTLHAQDLTSTQTREDLEFLKQGIQQYNPALAAYNPTFNQRTDEIITGLSGNNISLIDYFQQVSKICALSNEGHFAMGSWSDAIHAGFVKNQYTYLPISVKVLGGKLFIWIDNSEAQQLNRGDEILTINGHTTKTILSKIYECFPSDGQITTYTDRNIELGFSWMYYFFVEQAEQFKFKIKVNGKTEKEVTIKALTRETQFANFAKYYPKKEKVKESPFHSLQYVDEVAYFTLPSFDYRKIEKEGIKAKKFYESIFQELHEKQSKHLVVDLRGNTGGRNEFADDIVPFILKTSSKIPYLKKSVSWDGKEKTHKLPKPSKLVFKGAIYVLVDGRTYSAGSTLCRYLKEFGQAIVIGEETGSRYEGFSAGSKQYITLPHSKISIGIPRYHTKFPKSVLQTTSNRGVLPDHTIQYTITDIIQNKDLAMMKVKSLIEAKN